MTLRATNQSPPHIGSSMPRLDAREKVTGATRFAADWYGENLLWAGAKRAGVPHAILKGIDVRGAEAVPGVMRVLTHHDVGGSNRQGVIRKDQPVLADSKVRHCGDAVALVVAETKQALTDALARIVVEYEPLPGVFDPEQALAADAPRVHDDHATGNVLLQGDVTVGMGDEAASECAVIVETCFETQRQEHAYLETECGWARVEDDGRLVIVCSSQTPFRDRMEVADALGLAADRVRIIVPYVGGAFGGKDGVTVQTLVGLGALHAAGRPVKLWWDRDESFVAGTKRHAARMYYRLGATGDGTLHYLSVRLYFDTGPYDHLGGVVLTLALEHAGGAYRIPHAVLKGWAVYTNNPIGGAFRGFGVPQVTAAMEQTMDLLAERLGMDPLELRVRNALSVGDRNCVGKTLVSTTGLVECLEAVGSHELWRNRHQWRSSAGPFKRRGVGIAAVIQASGYGPVVPDTANAKIELTSEGRFRVYCGVVDMGQGNASTNAQIAASILGQPAELIDLVLPDTDRTLPSGSASASRCTYTFGNALIGAVNSLKARILQRAADLMMARGPHEVALIPGRVRNLRTGREAPLATMASFLNDSERVAVHRFRAPIAEDDVGAADDLRLHGFPHTLFSYGAHLALVAVDELTGCVDVERYLAVTDAGTVMNPQVYEQQIHGAVAQGIGFALTEDLQVQEGRVTTPSLFTYPIPTAADVPEIDSVAVELHEPSGPFGLKGVGEIAMNGPLPAIANAVADACGARIFRSPLTPERVLEVLRGTDQHGLASRRHDEP